MLEKLLGVAFAFLLLMLAGLMLFLGLGIGAYLWDEHRLLSVAIALIGVAVAAIVVRRRGAASLAAHATQPQANIHPGISMHAIPIGGGIGFVFAIGYVVMFWFGAPAYRPVVLGTVALGALLGAALIWFRRRSRAKGGNTSLLHLTNETETGPERAMESPKGPDNNALNLTSGVGHEWTPLAG